jgi:hypothetical protein
MSGRARLPSGEPRKASQRRTRRGPAATVAVRITPTWQPGNKVAWNGYVGTFLRDAVDDQAEVLINTRTYRVRRAELQSA